MSYHWRHSLLCLGLVCGLLNLVGCGGKKATTWEGKYENTKDKMILEIQPDHKAILRNETGPTDVTWETSGEDKITVHIPFPVEMFHLPDGGLRDTEGTVWARKS